MKKYNIPIIDIQSFDAENIITTSTTETWQQGYEEEGALIQSVSYNDLVTIVF